MIKIPEKISNKASLYAAIAIVAAILITVLNAIISSIPNITMGIRYMQYGGVSLISSAIGGMFGGIVGQLLPLSIAVFLFIKKGPRWLITIPLALTGISGILSIFIFIFGIISSFINGFSWNNFLTSLFLLFSAVILSPAYIYAAVHSAMTWTKKFNLGFISKLWFIPGALILISVLTTLLSNIFGIFSVYATFAIICSVITAILGLLCGLLMAAAYLLMGAHFNNLIDGDNKAIVE